MYLKYGSFTHDVDEVAIAIERQEMLTPSGRSQGYRERWMIDGMIMKDTLDEVTTQIQAIESAYATHGQDIGLYEDDGTATAHVLTSAACDGGTQITMRPSFPTGQTPEYVTWRTFRLAVEGTVTTNTNGLVEYAQIIEVRGNCGPAWRYFETLTGPPQLQVLRLHTTCKAAQRGYAVGNYYYPTPSSPLWPQFEHQDLRTVTRELPDTLGQKVRRVTWAFAFEADVPLLPSAIP